MLYKAAVSCIQHPPTSSSTSSSSTEWCAWLYYCSDRICHVRGAGHQYSDRSISRGVGGGVWVGDWNHSVEQQQQQLPIVDDTYYRFNADSLRHATDPSLDTRCTRLYITPIHHYTPHHPTSLLHLLTINHIAFFSVSFSLILRLVPCDRLKLFVHRVNSTGLYVASKCVSALSRLLIICHQ